jgi:hypothetical protein
MQQSRSPKDDLEAAVHGELVHLGLCAELVAVVVHGPLKWHVHLEVALRVFELGCNGHGNLYCWERTPEEIKHLISPDAPPVAGDAPDAVRKALIQVKYALGDPGFFVVGPPVI